MQRCAGSCSSRQFYGLGRVSPRAAPIAGAIALVALVTISIIEIQAIDLVETQSARLTIVQKNRLYPSISELEARAAKGEVSSDDSLRSKRLGQGI